MEFFSEKPELLDNTQTLFGVLITLIVLCLFNNDSNFLIRLIKNMIADFTKNLQVKMKDIWEDINLKEKKIYADLGGIVANRKYWVRQAEEKSSELFNRILENNKQEQDIIAGIFNNLEEPLKNFKETEKDINLKNESSFVSLFFLVLMLCVMLLDACCVSNGFGSIFLILLTYVSTYFTFSLWYRFLSDKEVGLKYPYNSSTKFFAIPILIGIILFLLWLVTIALWHFNFIGFWSFSFLYYIVLVAIVSYRLMSNFRYCERYNNQFVIKHSFYIISTCAIIAVLLYGLRNINIDNIDNGGVLLPLKQNIQIMQDNIDVIVNNSRWVRRVFVSLATCNTFFIPLLLGYYYNHKKATSATRQMEINKKTILNDLEDNINEYQEILKEIQGMD